MKHASYYFDAMATTPMDPRVAEKMAAYLTLDGVFGNPASISHEYGLLAKEAVEKARGTIARVLNVSSDSLIFTSGATESNNLALFGAARFYARNGRHIITAKTEHQSVIDVCQQLEREGFEITYLQPQRSGLILLSDLEAALRPETILVSLMHVNNEIGVIQNIKAMAALLKSRSILFHVDGAQSVGKIFVDLKALDLDLYSLSAHKLYGPKGIGALYIRREPRVRLEPLIYGGGHEQGLRSGTLATHQIVGMAYAYELASLELAEESARLLAYRNHLWKGLSLIPGVYLNGSETERVPGNLNFSVEGIDGNALLFALSETLALSASSACHSASLMPSRVLTAIGLSPELSQSAIRLGLHRFTKEVDIQIALDTIKKEIERLRQIAI